MKHETLLLSLLTLSLLGCGFLQSTVQPTVTPAPIATQTLTPTPSDTATPLSTPTHTPDIAAAEKTAEFNELMSKYFSFGSLEDIEGIYQPIEDYRDNLARSGYYSWSTYDIELRNFILRTTVRMSTANKPSDSTACGVVFRTRANHRESVFVQQNGQVYYTAGDTNYHDGDHRMIANPAEFEMVVVVDEQKHQVFIDGQSVLIGSSIFRPYPGGIGFAVQSGSDEDFGSQCNFTENDLWAIKRK